MEAEPSIHNRENVKKPVSYRGYEEIHRNQPPTEYLTTLSNFFKGNLNAGCYALADASKNGGFILATILTLIIAAICIHAQHLLVRCSESVQVRNKLELRPDYATTLELSFKNSKQKQCRRMAPIVKKTCNIFIVLTQLGYCSVTLVFVSLHVYQVLYYYNVKILLPLMIAIVLLPIWMIGLVRPIHFIGEYSNFNRSSS